MKCVLVKEKDFDFEDEQENSDLFTLEIRWLLVASKILRDLASLCLCVFRNGASPLCAFPVYMPGPKPRPRPRPRSRKPRGKVGYHRLTIKLIPTISK